MQQPPEDKGDVDANGIEGEAEHDRPNVPADWGNIVAAGHSCQLALFRASSVLAVAASLVAEAAISQKPSGLQHSLVELAKRFCSRPASRQGS
jgi:hypothetical protein